MNNKDAFIVLFIGFCLISTLCIFIPNITYSAYKQNINDKIDFGHVAHYVKFHIHPEQEGMGVAAWATDEFPPTSGVTDNNSEIVFPMISSAKYNILIDNNRCSYYIYPTESYYMMECLK